MALSPIRTVYPTWQRAVEAAAGVINRLINGETNSLGDVTLTASAASTTVTDQRAGLNRIVLLMPKTANAAAALATTYIDPAAVGAGTFTISHANNAQTDRSFRYVILG